jgi:hypothetical protein
MVRFVDSYGALLRIILWCYRFRFVATMLLLSLLYGIEYVGYRFK